FLHVVGSSEDESLDCLTIVSEYPNLAEAFALRHRLHRYRVLGVHGAAANYPPEHADLALVASNKHSQEDDLPLVAELGRSRACLVANRQALASKDLSSLLGGHAVPSETDEPSRRRPSAVPSGSRSAAAAYLALPDGHQQREAPEICRAAGLRLHQYEEDACTPRPVADGEDLGVKVIRPQDMPQMVAVGAFDLAITGRDCLLNHLAQFPSSPVEELVDLGRQRYRWAAVVHEELRADNLQSALATWREQGRETIRIASEYPNLADQFARERHLGRYRVIPVVGASEGFVPEDAEILIEGSETGRTWAANNLVPLEWLFESTMVVIAHTNRRQRPNDGQVERLVARFRQAA
ncbi:MAG TPA: ATP phosphoribosyltransferase, partial [Dehalococcoidia bacterium]|nr:ATP phosphoribosyltransferase [Dehalococcoidia bacterium]